MSINDDIEMHRGPRRRCPVCWRRVQRTIHETIEGHWDAAMRPCPGSSHPYRITLESPPRRKAA